MRSESSSLLRTIGVMRHYVDEGTCLGMQLSCVLGGQQIDIVVGQRRPCQAMRDDVLLNWQSTAKPVAVVAIALLVDVGCAA